MLDFNNIIHDSKEGAWQRPKTTRRYLHPPRSERLFTLWNEGKIIMGENHLGENFKDYPKMYSSGIWIVQSRHCRSMDFRKAELSLPQNGTPIHMIENQFGGFKAQIEAFCNIERRCTCFIKVTIKNSAPYMAKEKVGLLFRSGYEQKLINDAADLYNTYTSEISGFKDQPATFKRDGNVFYDDNAFVTVNTDLEYTFDEAEGVVWFNPSLFSGECAEILMEFGKGEPFEFDYDTEKAKTVNFWNGELSRINTLPKSIANDPEKFRMIQNMTVQTLQCFCSYVGTDYTVLRQGGLQRLIWPWEAMLSISALSRIGNFDDYIEDFMDFYFKIQQQPDGEVRPLGENWATVTSSALYSLVSYCMNRDSRKAWDKYRDNALLCFKWIYNKRREAPQEDWVLPGIFPPMRGSDWFQIFQHWSVNDAHSLIALQELAKAMEYFGDPEAECVLEECKDYSDRLLEIFSKAVNSDPNSAEIRVPLTPNGDDSFLIQEFYPNLTEAAVLVALSDRLPESAVDRLKARFVRVGLAKNGLYGRMPYPNGETHIWYTSIPDYDWFKLFHKLGRYDEAYEVIEAQIKYSMTDEYYMLERYKDNDPYFAPWSPNVSAMGRLINMMLDYFG